VKKIITVLVFFHLGALLFCQDAMDKIAEIAAHNAGVNLVKKLPEDAVTTIAVLRSETKDAYGVYIKELTAVFQRSKKCKLVLFNSSEYTGEAAKKAGAQIYLEVKMNTGKTADGLFIEVVFRAIDTASAEVIAVSATVGNQEDVEYYDE
jgi:hypothetical protein